MEVVEASNSYHVDRDPHRPVGAWLRKNRREFNVTVGEILMEDERVEDHGAEEGQLVVDVPRVGTGVAAPLISVALEAEVGLDKVTRGSQPVVPVVDHERLYVLQRARGKVLVRHDEVVVVGGVVSVNAHEVAGVDGWVQVFDMA